MCCQAAIRKELNEFKSAEMEVHEESKKFTRYTLYSLLSGLGLEGICVFKAAIELMLCNGTLMMI